MLRRGEIISKQNLWPCNEFTYIYEYIIKLHINKINIQAKTARVESSLSPPTRIPSRKNSSGTSMSEDLRNLESKLERYISKVISFLWLVFKEI